MVSKGLFVHPHQSPFIIHHQSSIINHHSSFRFVSWVFVAPRVKPSPSHLVNVQHNLSTQTLWILLILLVLLILWILLIILVLLILLILLIIMTLCMALSVPEDDNELNKCVLSLGYNYSVKWTLVSPRSNMDHRGAVNLEITVREGREKIISATWLKRTERLTIGFVPQRTRDHRPIIASYDMKNVMSPPPPPVPAPNADPQAKLFHRL